jgi:hypothetical protein
MEQRAVSEGVLLGHAWRAARCHDGANTRGPALPFPVAIGGAATAPQEGGEIDAVAPSVVLWSQNSWIVRVPKALAEIVS